MLWCLHGTAASYEIPTTPHHDLCRASPQPQTLRPQQPPPHNSDLTTTKPQRVRAFARLRCVPPKSASRRERITRDARFMLAGNLHQPLPTIPHVPPNSPNFPAQSSSSSSHILILIHSLRAPHGAVRLHSINRERHSDEHTHIACGGMRENSTTSILYYTIV